MENISTKTVKQFDWILFLTMLCLLVVGVLAIYSATYNSGSSYLKQNYERQLIWAAIGAVLFVTMALLHFKYYQAFAYVLYGFSIVLLLFVLAMGRMGGGAVRWISIGGLRFQPSEWAKLFTIFALARYLSDNTNRIRSPRVLITAFAIGLLPMVLIFEEPDLGTSLVFAAIIPSILFWADVSPLALFLIAAPFLTMLASFNFYTFFADMVLLVGVLYFVKRPLIFSVANVLLNLFVGIMTPFMWNSLHAYQQKRILTFLGLISDPRGLSYQIIQSKVAIGSGGLWGKGFLHGTQTQLRFLPAQHTDFIFSVIGEEFGFMGAMLVLFLFALLLYRGFKISAVSKNNFTGLVGIGITTMFLYHAVVNIGMATGIMPVTGLPLPFVSYGGSFLLMSMASMGVLESISIRKYEY